MGQPVCQMLIPVIVASINGHGSVRTVAFHGDSVRLRFEARAHPRHSLSWIRRGIYAAILMNVDPRSSLTNHYGPFQWCCSMLLGNPFLVGFHCAVKPQIDVCPTYWHVSS